ncbi:MAG: alginate lyase family protein [Rhodospirillaceae bacterium]|nr:alginate lyase family protein [Rhodospirillaceae bacterium]
MRWAALAVVAALLVTPALAADPRPRGYALIPPDTAAALSSLAASPARAAALRAADRVATRSPHAMARVHVEGTLPGQGIYDQSAEALRDLPAARDLALASRLTGDARYAEASVRLMAAWIGTYQVAFNPIDETGFDMLMVAWDLLAPGRRAGLEEGYGRMLHAFARGYLDRPLKGGTAVNNWNSHRVKLIVLAAFALEDPALIAEARAAYVAQLRANIRADGSTIDFELRDAIHYVVFDMEPLATVALAARQHGQDWVGEADGALIRALAWLEPYAIGSRTHVEFANTRITFDRTRRDAGVKGFEGMFDPKKARTAMALAGRLDPRFVGTARAMRTEPWQDAWLELLIPIR